MKHGKNDKFKGIEKMKERETLFIEYVAEMKKREKEGVKVKQEKVCISVRLEWWVGEWGVIICPTDLVILPESILCLKGPFIVPAFLFLRIVQTKNQKDYSQFVSAKTTFL